MEKEYSPLDLLGRTISSDASIGDSYKELCNVFPKNIFLIKLNYLFSLYTNLF